MKEFKEKLKLLEEAEMVKVSKGEKIKINIIDPAFYEVYQYFLKKKREEQKSLEKVERELSK